MSILFTNFSIHLVVHMQRFIDLRRGKKAQKIVLIAHRDHGYVEHRSDSSVV